MKKESYIDSDGQELTKNTFSDGSIWYKNKRDQWHRLDGPSYIATSGYKSWYKDDLRHREDGPAVIWSNGTEEYWLNGEEVSKREVDVYWLKKRVQE